MPDLGLARYSRDQILAALGLSASDNILTDVSNNVVLNKDLSASSNTLPLITDTRVSTTAAIAWSKIAKTGSQIQDIANVAISSLTDGQALIWQASTSKWINGNVSGGGGGGGSGDMLLGTVQTVTAAKQYNDGTLKLWNPLGTILSTVKSGAQTVARIFTFPVVSADDTILTLAATQTPTNKTYNIDQNTLKHSTTNAAGDLLLGNGSSYQRLARGTANQVLGVSSDGLSVGYTTLQQERTGKAIASGNGSITIFTIPHGLGSVPSYAFVDCSSHAIARTWTVDSTNITVTFASAPSSGTNNVIIYWRVLA